MKTILAPVDFSAVTDCVCETAVALAKSQRGRVVLLHSVPPPAFPDESAAGLADPGIARDQAAADRLIRLREKLVEEYLPIETMQLFGPAVPNILEQAEKLGAAYLVLGSHDHSSFHELFVGSTTHSVLLKAACPVVVIHEGTRMSS